MKSIRTIQRAYLLITGLFWFTTAMPIALMVLLHQSRGLDLFQIGVLMGAYSLTIVLLEIPTGGLADAFGRKKVTQLAYTISLVSGFVFLFAFSFATFLLAWILAGISRALGSGALDAWFVDSLQAADPEIDIQPPLAKAGTVALLALGCGTLIGGIIPRLFAGLPADGTAVLTPMSVILLFAGLLNLVLIFAVTILISEKRPDSSHSSWRVGFSDVPVIVGQAISLSRKKRKIIILLVLSLFSGLGLATIETFWQPHFAELLGGGEGRTILFGLVMAVAFVVGAIGNLASIPLGQRLNGRYELLAGIMQGLQGLAFLLLGYQAGIGVFVFFFWFIYLASGVINSPFATLYNQQVPADRRSSMLSIQSLSSYVGGIVGSVVLGFVANTVSIALAWAVAGALLLVSLPLYLKLDSRQTARIEQHEPETAVL